MRHLNIFQRDKRETLEICNIFKNLFYLTNVLLFMLYTIITEIGGKNPHIIIVLHHRHYTWYFGLNESLMALSLTWLSLTSQVAHALNAYSYLLKKIKKWWLWWLSNLHCFRWKCLIQSRVMITNFIHSQYDSKSKYYSPLLCYKSSFKAFIRQLHYAIVY